MRGRACALMMTLLLLSGCGGGGSGKGGSPADELALRIRTEYLAMAACAATAQVTADYGQRVYEYTLSVSWQRDGETVLKVLSPESIAGLTARVRDGSASLEYDGASLETGPLDGQGLSPMEAIPGLLEAVCSGYIAECDFETEGESALLWICCRDPNGSPGKGTETAFWFDADTHALRRTELLSDGRAVLRCEWTEFTKE